MRWQGLMGRCWTPEGSVVDSRTGKPQPSTRIPKPNSSFQRLSSSDIGSPATPREVEDIFQSSASNAQAFTLSEIKVVTRNFRSDHVLGGGGFGTVHKGYIDDNVRPGQKAMPVAVKVLDHEGLQGHREWLAEVIYLGQLSHPHLVKLVGYCCEDEERVLVYEYMPRGSLENHLFRSDDMWMKHHGLRQNVCVDHVNYPRMDPP